MAQSTYKVRTGFLLSLIILFTAFPLAGQDSWAPVKLPSGKILLEPPAGQLIGALNAFPINSALSRDGRFIAFLNNGFGHSSSGFRKSVALYDRMTGQIADIAEPGTGLYFNGRANICTPFYGIAFSSDGKKLYVSLASTLKDPKLGDRTQNGIRIHRLQQDRGMVPEGVIPIPPSDVVLPPSYARNNPAPTPSGLAVRPDPSQPGEDLVYAALTLSDTVVELSTKSKKVVRTFSVHQPHHPAIPAEYPYAVALSPDYRSLFVTLYNGSAVAQVDLSTAKVQFIPVGTQIPGGSMPSSHPSHLVMHPSGKFVFVAVENSDQLTVIGSDPQAGDFLKVVNNIDLRPEPMRQKKILGAGPNHLAFSADGKWLSVSAGLLNAVALLKIEDRAAGGLSAELQGYLPTLWYPHTVDFSPDGTELYITSGKGKGTGTNKPIRPMVPGQNPGLYAPTLLRGSLHVIRMEEALRKIGVFTQAVLRNNQLDASTKKAESEALAFNPIKHVIYVIKENRTYDQVFGDLEGSDADQTCLYFGEPFTPNHHRLAREFGVYDNFHVSAEVSFNGHTWTTAGINSGWNEQQWQINYSTGNFTYDSEGRNNEIVPLYHDQSDVDTPQSGYIWDSILLAGKTLGMFGEFCDNPPNPLRILRKGDPFPDYMIHPKIGRTSSFSWEVPVYAEIGVDGQRKGGIIPNKKAFDQAYQPLYPGWDLLFPDVLRFRIWQRDFEKIADKQKKTGEDSMPALSIVRLGNNHTRGVQPGGPTPDASVADNDLALGWLVESISGNDYYWSNTAIIVLEDDAQAGCDHVDSHRSPMLFISKYNTGSAARSHQDSRFLTTASCIRTIEALLGIPPNNLMTATAPLLFESLSSRPDSWHKPYVADTRNLDNGLIFTEADGAIRKNKVLQEMARISARLEMDEADEADANALNYVLERWVESQGRLTCCSASEGRVRD